MRIRKKPGSKKAQLIFLGIFLAAALGLKLWQYYWPDAIVSLKGEELRVLVAKSPWHWHRGLGKRESLGAYDGMLFIFPLEDKYGIVMRDMHFPIDIVWLDRGKVVDFAPDVPTEPGREEHEFTVYRPREAGNMVLELPAGWVRENELKIGDRMTVVEE